MSRPSGMRYSTPTTPEVCELPVSKGDGARRRAAGRTTPWPPPSVQQRQTSASKCRQAADALLSLDWGCAHAGVRAVVEDMVVNIRASRDAVFWLLVQSAKLPYQTEAARCLLELTVSIQKLRAERLPRRSLY